jgi:hypothetical protein
MEVCMVCGVADLDCEDNLREFIDMGDGEEGFGSVLREEEFLEFCKYSAVDEDIPPAESIETKH